jgi:hypothetical protein
MHNSIPTIEIILFFENIVERTKLFQIKMK